MLYSFLVLADGKEAYPLIIHLKSVQVFPYIVAPVVVHRGMAGCMAVAARRVVTDCMAVVVRRVVTGCMAVAARGVVTGCMAVAVRRVVAGCMAVAARRVAAASMSATDGRGALVPGNSHCCRECYREDLIASFLCGSALPHTLLFWAGR